MEESKFLKSSLCNFLHSVYLFPRNAKYNIFLGALILTKKHHEHIERFQIFTVVKCTLSSAQWHKLVVWVFFRNLLSVIGRHKYRSKERPTIINKNNTEDETTR